MNIHVHLGVEVALFMATVLACLVNVYYLGAWFHASKGMAFMRLLRIIGWLVISARLEYVVINIPGIQTSLPAAIALFFLAAGEISALFLRGKVGVL